MKEKKEMREQVKSIIGREISDDEFRSIDFSGAIDDQEPTFDEYLSVMQIFGPMSFIATGVVCILFKINIREPSFFIVGMVSAILFCIFGMAICQKKHSIAVKEQILEAIKKYDERESFSE